MAGSAVTWVDGDISNAVKLNALPRGIMAFATGSAQSGISAVTDLTGASVTFTAISTRAYKTTLYIPRVDQITTTGVTTAIIATGASALLCSGVINIASGAFAFFHVVILETGLSGSTTRKGRLQTSGGTVSTVSPVPQIFVEDMGLA